MAVINDFNMDLHNLLKADGLTQTDIANKLGIAQQIVSRSANGSQFKDSFVKVIEALGYDIKVSYVKREKTVEEVITDERRKADRNQKG